MGADPYHQQHEDPHQEQDNDTSNRGYNINSNTDILSEILTRLDGRSLAVASCVCKLWSSLCRRDSTWEALCNRHVAGGAGTRSVVLALGGYRKLYRLCLGPALDRLTGTGSPEPDRLAGTGLGEPGREGWAHLSLSLSLSLFSIDCYEKLGLGGKQRPASLLFLCKPLNVS